MTAPRTAIARVGVFCGARAGTRAMYTAVAHELGDALARRGVAIVYGGANIGLMATVADAALARGGHVIGVIPEAIADLELAHRGLTELRVVGSMHARKAVMAELADAFIALPGGFGTLEELVEMLTWNQLGIHRKPCALLNVAGYFDALLAWCDHAAREGFLGPGDPGLLLGAASVEALLEHLVPAAAPPTAFVSV